MERSKRSDLPIWRNPCGKAIDADQNGTGQRNIDERAAEKVKKSATHVLEYAQDYQDRLANMTLTCDFNAAMNRHGEIESVLNTSWYKLPTKNLGEPLEDSYLNYAKKNLPAMYKYLELVIGAMEQIPASSEFTNTNDSILRNELDCTLGKMKMLLCEFDLLLLDRGIRKLKSLEMDEVPPRPSGDTEGGLNDFLVFRDTLNFLETMKAVFEHMAEHHQ